MISVSCRAASADKSVQVPTPWVRRYRHSTALPCMSATGGLLSSVVRAPGECCHRGATTCPHSTADLPVSPRGKAPANGGLVGRVAGTPTDTAVLHSRMQFDRTYGGSGAGQRPFR